MAFEGQIIHDRYRLVSVIGQGGMSVVWIAQDTNLGSFWAIKVVKNDSSVQFDAFLREVDLLSTLNHPDIPRIVDRIELGDEYFVVMDFVSGTTLGKVLHKYGPQEEQQVIDWGILLCDILRYLHTAQEAPIIYRDMKPENVILTPSGRVNLIDFGIALPCPRGQRVQGEALGTKGYAAPEQYKGASGLLDERSDVYSLGATLFCLATGTPPGKPPGGVPALRSVNPDLSDAFEYCLAKATADDPDSRYESAEAFRKDLANIETLSRVYRKKMKRHMALFLSSFVLSIACAATGLVGYFRVQNDLADVFQSSFQSATAYEREGDSQGAAVQYARAIAAKPADRETHVRLFRNLLPADGEENARAKTMEAIDEMRKSYLENTRSPLCQDPALLYMTAKRCIEVQDAVYAGYAKEYITVIQESEDYAAGAFDSRELQSLAVIAAHQAQESDDTDYTQFAASLAELEEYTDTASLSPDERLANYYTLIQMYSTYPANLDGAFEKAYEIGGKARSLLESNAADENMSFNNIIPMYELLASGQYNSAAYYTADAEKEKAYQNSLEWFRSLDALGVGLPENLQLKKANAHLGIFELYNTPGGGGEKNQTHLASATRLYEEMTAKNSLSFLPNVYLTKARLYAELLKPQEERSMAGVLESYARTASLASGNTELGSTELMQYSALQRQLQSAGLEV